MIRFVRNVLLIVAALILIPLSVSNRHPVTLSLNPFNPEDPNLTLTGIPLFWIIFASLAIGIVLGGIGAWAKQGKWRQEARQKRREVKKIQVEADQLRQLAGQPVNEKGLPAPDKRNAA